MIMRHLRCIINNSFAQSPAPFVTLSVTPDVAQPVVSDAATLNSNTVQVTFSKPVEPASATNIANYSQTED